MIRRLSLLLVLLCVRLNLSRHHLTRADLFETLDDLLDQPVRRARARRHADFLHARKISRIYLCLRLNQKALRTLLLAHREQFHAI